MSRFSRRLARKQRQRLDRTNQGTLSPAEMAGLRAGLGPLSSKAQLISTLPPWLEHLPKLSESLIELARPLLEPIADTASDDMFRRLFGGVALAWNVGRDEMQGEQALADQAREALRSIAVNAGESPEEVGMTFEYLVALRKSRFADDPRAVGSVEVIRTPDGLRVNATTIVLPPKR